MERKNEPKQQNGRNIKKMLAICYRKTDGVLFFYLKTQETKRFIFITALKTRSLIDLVSKSYLFARSYILFYLCVALIRVRSNANRSFSNETCKICFETQTYDHSWEIHKRLRHFPVNR